jgi:hypothetical protein
VVEAPKPRRSWNAEDLRETGRRRIACRKADRRRSPEVVEKPIVKSTPPPGQGARSTCCLAPVFVIDPVGRPLAERDEAEAKAVSLEKAAYKDKFSTRNGTAAFTLEARTSVMLEKNSEVAFWHQKTDERVQLALDQGWSCWTPKAPPRSGRFSFGNTQARASTT